MPNYPFTRNIPDGPNNPSNDQPIMQTNSNSTDSIIAEDHFGFNNDNGGSHKKSTYIVQAAPGPTPLNTNGAQSIVYSSTVNGVAELFVNRFGNATPVQLTKGGLSASSNGYTFLPGGVIIQWGTGNASLAGADNNFPVSFPVAVWSLTATEIGNDRLAISVEQVTKDGFKAYSQTGRTIYFIAIGN